MTIQGGAPQGADVPSASSSATKPAPAGRPSRQSLTASLRAKEAEKPEEETAISTEGAQPDAAPGDVDAEKKPEGDTADPEAGKGDKKPIEKKAEPETVPMAAFKERLAKEKGRREKLEADLHGSKANEAKLKHLFEVAAAENERLTELLASGQKFDERGEELHALKLQREVETRFAKMQEEHQQALADIQRDQQIGTLAEQMRSEVAAACEAFPLVSPAEVRAALRSNPSADIRQLAQAKHEERMAFVAKQGGKQAKSDAPTTVGKPTGTAKFLPPLTRKGMAQAFAHARAKG